VLTGRAAGVAIRRACVGLVLAASAARADDDPPSAPAVRGETRLLADQFVRHQIAPPLPLADGSALLFQRDGDGLVLWRIRPGAPERSQRVPRPDIHLVFDLAIWSTREADYASVETRAGDWLIGPTIALLRPDGHVVARPMPRPRCGARALALADGSVLVIGGVARDAADTTASLHVDRVSPRDDGGLDVQAWPDLPARMGGGAPLAGPHDASAIVLRGGRVLVTGGEDRKVTWLWDPRARRWETIPGVDVARDRPALIELADGRVWATGGSWLSGRDAMATSSSLWDPATRRWSPGPDLPVPMKRHVAIWSADHRTVLLGAGEHGAVLAWTPGEPVVRIAAAPALQRSLGALLALDDGRVAEVSGLHARAYSEAWGRRSPGASVFDAAAPDVARDPLWPQLLGGAVAARGGRVVAFGGRDVQAQAGSRDEDATRAVELQSLASGRVRSLAPLPAPIRDAQALWLDDRRVLVLGQAAVGNGPDGFLGVLDVASDRWQVLDAIPFDSRRLIEPAHGRATILGADAGKVWLSSEDGTVTSLDTATFRFDKRVELPWRARWREGASGRLLADGRIVLAGGMVEPMELPSRPESCRDDCDVTFIGWGPRAPARTFDVWHPRTKAWSNSPRAKGAARRAVVLADGHVVAVSDALRPVDDGRGPAHLAPGLEVADVATGRWRPLPWPEGARPVDGLDEADAALMLRAPQGDDPLAASALFLGIEAVEPGIVQWWWMPAAGTPGATWRALGRADAPWRFPPGGVDLGVKSGRGRPLRAIGSDGGVVLLD
jgi:hypothetical protein